MKILSYRDSVRNSDTAASAPAITLFIVKYLRPSQAPTPELGQAWTQRGLACERLRT